MSVRYASVHVVERGEKLEPPLNARIVVPHYADALECLIVIGKDAKLRAPNVASRALDGPDNAAESSVARNRGKRG